MSDKNPSIVWYIGRTRREHAAVTVSLLGFCLALVWALLNDLSYGYEGAEPPPSLLHTNGRYPVPVVLGVFFGFVGMIILGVVLFWCFRAFDKRR